MSLTLADANRMIEGAMAKASELDIKISCAVVDAGGRLLAFQRMEDATWASAYGSQGKAIASVGFGQTSGNAGEEGSRSHHDRDCCGGGRSHDHEPGRRTDNS